MPISGGYWPLTGDRIWPKTLMKLLSLSEANTSRDMDVKMIATRASRYRVFGSAERIPDADLAVADLRDGKEPEDFEQKYQVLDRHPMAPIVLVRKLD